jgi:hypothetical protein
MSTDALVANLPEDEHHEEPGMDEDY